MKLTSKINNLPSLFENNKKIITGNDLPEITLQRLKALKEFEQMGLPNTRDEEWKNTSLKKQYSEYYVFDFEKNDTTPESTNVFEKKIPGFHTFDVALYNGIFFSQDGEKDILPDGVIVTSFAKAIKSYPDLVKKYFNTTNPQKKNGLLELNTAFVSDGLFIFVPRNVKVSLPIQLFNVLNGQDRVFIQNRNLIILEKNSELELVYSDDSHNETPSFTNTVTEIFVGENARCDLYKMQNLNNVSTLVSSVFVKQKRDSRFSIATVTLNGGVIRNDTQIELTGEGGEANVYGLYLADKQQHIDNQVFIDHAAKNCKSEEIFKGVMDDQASGVFKGHVLVRRDSQKTNAYQTNRNILLTDKATIYSKPFLEIYADDVKCSHGSTTGQLDDEALFYIRSRGVGEKKARLLLIYAFAAEVVNKVKLDILREMVDDLVKKRLKGELTICELCVLQCSTPENLILSELNFE